MTKQVEATVTSNRGKVYRQIAAVFDSLPDPCMYAHGRKPQQQQARKPQMGNAKRKPECAGLYRILQKQDWRKQPNKQMEKKT